LQLDALRGHYPVLKDIERFLAAKRKEGFDFINFTGGEPTHHPDFIKIVSFAKKLGFKTYIGTNGFLLKDQDFCKKVVRYMDEISLSVHGYDKKSHDVLAGRRGAFEDIGQAFKNLKKLKFKNIYANIVVTNKNFKDIKKIIGFLAKNGVRQVLISSVAPEGRGAEAFKNLSPKLFEWRKEIPSIAAICDKKKIVVRFFGLPLCVLHNIALSNDLSWDPRITTESVLKKGKIKQITTGGFLPTRKRIKTKLCSGCLYNDSCCGIFEAYYKIYKDKELRPKTK
jgi:MoaA/NifB/PqqE/SkfB family radical SAM enzyme